MENASPAETTPGQAMPCLYPLNILESRAYTLGPLFKPGFFLLKNNIGGVPTKNDVILP